MSTITPTSPVVGNDRPWFRGRPSRWRLGIALAAVLLLLVVLGGVSALVLRSLLDPGEAVAGVTAVAVRDNAFAPAAIEVPAGTVVNWTWEGEEQHNVVGEGFESPVQSDGALAHAFAEPGTHAYRCTLHYLMRGEVVVTE